MSERPDPDQIRDDIANNITNEVNRSAITPPNVGEPMTDTVDYAEWIEDNLGSSKLEAGDNVSSLTNDAGYITANDLPAPPPDPTTDTVANDSLIVSGSSTTDALDNLGNNKLQSGDNVSTLTNDVPYIVEGSGKVGVIPEFTSTSSTNAVNLSSGVPYQLKFSGVALSNPDLSIDANGATTIVTAGTYVFDIIVNADTSTNQDVSLWLRAVINGTQGGRTIHLGMSVNGDYSSVESAIELALVPNDVVTFEVLTNSSQINLVKEDTNTAGWAASECESVSIYKRKV